MQFKEILTRYHISPLKYEDDELLDEKDYTDLFIILQKYFIIKNIVEETKIPSVPENLMKKVNSMKNSLIPFSFEELMDIMLEQNKKEVL